MSRCGSSKTIAFAGERETDLIAGDPEFKPLEKYIKIDWLKKPFPRRKQ